MRLRVVLSSDRAWPSTLRHSCGSYRVATLKDVAAVSLKMDNSPAIIKIALPRGSRGEGGKRLF